MPNCTACSSVWYLHDQVSYIRADKTYNIFCGRITKHHLVQMLPVATNARFCVKESLSAGRRKSAAPARTTPHFITGALFEKKSASIAISKLYLVALFQLLFAFVDKDHPHQKWTVLTPTSLVHNFCNKLWWGGGGGASTTPAVVW